MRAIKIIIKIIGFISLGIGCVGIVVPLLPTTPFLLVAGFCFAKSSKQLHTWFLSTNIYKRHLEIFVKEKSMTWKTKLSILTCVSLFLGISIWAMKGIYPGQIAVTIVWIIHMIYFGIIVKTKKKSDSINCD